MKKNVIYKLLIVIFIIQFIGLIFFNTYAASEPTTLSEFVNKYGVQNMTDDQIEKKRNDLLKELSNYDQTSAMTISQTVGTILNQAEQQKNYSDKMKYLENEFSTQAQYLVEGNQASLDSYLYYGYMLGSTWVIYKKAQEGDDSSNNGGNNQSSNEQTPAQKFDAKYDEYTKLTEEQKKNPLTLKKYSESLKQLFDQLPASDKTEERQNKLDNVSSAYIDTDSSALNVPKDTPIYKEPNIIVGSSGSGSLDDMMSDADDFVKQGNNVATISQEQLQNFSQTLYNILLTIGIVVAVIVGGILGIKFMTSSLDEKAKVKQMFVAYVVGCAVVFGSFGIWKLVVTILQSI